MNKPDLTDQEKTKITGHNSTEIELGETPIGYKQGQSFSLMESVRFDTSMDRSSLDDMTMMEEFEDIWECTSCTFKNE